MLSSDVKTKMQKRKEKNEKKQSPLERKLKVESVFSGAITKKKTSNNNCYNPLR
ncbi:hypothetical protein DOY81_003357 [Sarcophaga bullata]|nr:hypothetical protein DOY81_003357 [Sarcophaga bullata]